MRWSRAWYPTVSPWARKCVMASGSRGHSTERNSVNPPRRRSSCRRHIRLSIRHRMRRSQTFTHLCNTRPFTESPGYSPSSTVKVRSLATFAVMRTVDESSISLERRICGCVKMPNKLLRIPNSFGKPLEGVISHEYAESSLWGLLGASARGKSPSM